MFVIRLQVLRNLVRLDVNKLVFYGKGVPRYLFVAGARGRDLGGPTDAMELRSP